jgi:Na+/phosphate symporter
MGFLGLCLLFAGMALIKEGAAIPQRDMALTAFTNPVNRATSLALLIGNFIGFVRAGIPAPAGNAAGGV